MPEKLRINNIIVELSNFHGRLQKGTDVTLSTASYSKSDSPLHVTPKLQFGTGKTGYTRTRKAPTRTRPDP